MADGVDCISVDGFVKGRDQSERVARTPIPPVSIASDLPLTELMLSILPRYCDGEFGSSVDISTSPVEETVKRPKHFVLRSGIGVRGVLGVVGLHYSGGLRCVGLG